MSYSLAILAVAKMKVPQPRKLIVPATSPVSEGNSHRSEIPQGQLMKLEEPLVYLRLMGRDSFSVCQKIPMWMPLRMPWESNWLQKPKTD